MELGPDLDIGQYVASGVVVFDLHRRTIKWSQVGREGWGSGGTLGLPRCAWREGQTSPATRRVALLCGLATGAARHNVRNGASFPPQHLDLSSDYTSFKAYAYSEPTLADIDGDGKLEVILGTSMVRAPLSLAGAAIVRRDIGALPGRGHATQARLACWLSGFTVVSCSTRLLTSPVFSTGLPIRAGQQWRDPARLPAADGRHPGRRPLPSCLLCLTVVRAVATPLQIGDVQAVPAAGQGSRGARVAAHAMPPWRA